MISDSLNVQMQQTNTIIEENKREMKEQKEKHQREMNELKKAHRSKVRDVSECFVAYIYNIFTKKSPKNIFIT